MQLCPPAGLTAVVTLALTPGRCHCQAQDCAHSSPAIISLSAPAFLPCSDNSQLSSSPKSSLAPWVLAPRRVSPLGVVLGELPCPGGSVGRAEEPSRGSCSLAGLPQQRHWESSKINQHLLLLCGSLLMSTLQQEGVGGTWRRLCCPQTPQPWFGSSSPKQGFGHRFDAIFWAQV